MQMDTGDYCVGSGHEKESRTATDGRCGSWMHDRTTKDNHKTRLGDEGQGMLVEAQTLTGGNIMRAKALPKTRHKQSYAKKKRERQRENRQQVQSYLQNTTLQHNNLTPEKRKTSKNNADKTQNAKLI